MPFGQYGISGGGGTPGTEKWEFTTGGCISASPVIGSDGTIYVGSSDHKLYAVNPDGTKKWEFATGDFPSSSPAVGLDGTVYVGSDDHKLYAVNPDGTKKWEFATGDVVQSSPAIGADGTIYVGSGDNNIYAINPDGSSKWCYQTFNLVVWTAPDSLDTFLSGIGLFLVVVRAEIAQTRMPPPTIVEQLDVLDNCCFGFQSGPKPSLVD
jgi:glucose dehydrogenase